MAQWITKGFEAFRRGQFGNGGQNLYVSHAGILQRIFRYDFTNDGWFDLVFVNSQDMDERPPVYVYNNVLEKTQLSELPTLGAYAAALADLNGDGYEDLIIANQSNGVHSDVTAFVYFGNSEGLSERYKLELPAPDSRAVAIGDFNGDGLHDIAFASGNKLRVFYQTPEGFIPSDYADFDLDLAHIAAGDVDQDGYADLYVRAKDGSAKIIWGGANGLNPETFTNVGTDEPYSLNLPSSTPSWLPFIPGWRPKILWLKNKAYLYKPETEGVYLFPVKKDRTLGKPLVFKCPGSVSAACGDTSGNGLDDIIFAVNPSDSGTAESVVYLQSHNGFSEENKIFLSTTAARDCAVADLNGNGFADIVICQGSTDILHSTESLVFQSDANGINSNPVALQSHDAATVLVGNTCADKTPQVILVNHVAGRIRGDVNVSIYHGGPEGYSKERRQQLPGWSAPDSIACDFNDNGWADLFVVNCAENAPLLDPGSFLYSGGPDGFLPDNKSVFPTYRAHGAAAGDFRRSGYIDIAVVGAYNPEMRIFKQDSNGFDLDNPVKILLDPTLKEYTAEKKKFQTNYRIEEHQFDEPRWILAADFNNNGWLDLFVSQIQGKKCLILWGGADGFSIERATWLAAEGTSCAQAADLTGNGYLDLVIGGHQCLSKKHKWESYIYIYWGGPDGFREDRRTQLPAHTCNSLTIADFNQNGLLDIFATSYNSGRSRDLDSYIYWGMPGGNYSVTNRTRLFSHSACGCIAADFNEDGWVDLAVASHKTYGNHQGFSHVWWNGPNGFNEQHRTFLPTNGPHGMTAVDPGNIKDRSFEEYYVSEPFKLPEGSNPEKISWDAQILPKTWVKAQLRTAHSQKELGQAQWRGNSGPDTWFENGQKTTSFKSAGQWIQYRLAIGSINGANSPRISSVIVKFSQ